MEKKIKVLSVFGTRPEAIKMVPVIKELEKSEAVESIVCVTAQHRDMLDQVLETFDVKPEYDLDIMKHRQTLTEVTANILTQLDIVIKEVEPDILLVHGDTATTFASSLAAFYNKVAVGHVEAGLRTFSKYNPFPEEMNRVLVGRMADIHFAPTKNSEDNLLAEGVDKDLIHITGNTAIDLLKYTVKSDYKFEDKTLNNIDFKNKKVIAVTAHRRENLGEPLENICNAIAEIIDNNENVEVVYAVHKNPAVRDIVNKFLGKKDRIHLVEPLDILDMHNLMDRCYMIMSDSGGIQEEAPSLGKPVMVLRRTTERPEGVEAGTLRLVGTEKDVIVKEANELLNNKSEYEKMAKAVNPFGDGTAAIKITKIIEQIKGKN